MAERNSAPETVNGKNGWQSDSSPDDYQNVSSSGRGATTADHPRGEAGEGTFGGGRGSDYPVIASGRPGPGEPEYPHLGWGGPGENYPPAQGPLGAAAEEAEHRSERSEEEPPEG